MRPFYALISLTLILALSAAVIVYQIQDTRQASRSDKLLIKQLLEDFFKSDSRGSTYIDYKPFYRENMKEIFSEPLIRLDLLGKNWRLGGKKEYCGNLKKNGRRGLVEGKLLRWQIVDCYLAYGLPDSFFAQPPLLHPSGNSFAYLAYLTEEKQFRSKEWLEKNILFFRARELSKLDLDSFYVPNEIRLLATLNQKSLNRFLKQERFISAHDQLLRRSRWPGTSFYIGKPKQKLANFLKGKEYYVDLSQDPKNCFYDLGELCWKRDLTSAFRVLGLVSKVLLIGLVLLIFSLLLFLLLRLRKERAAKEKQRFALEVLTHEFRTPVTNLLLKVDQLNRIQAQLPDNEKSIASVISGEVYRLQRLVEESQKYLKLSHSQNLIEAKVETIQSMNEFVLSFTEFHDEDLQFIGLKNDTSFESDPYWLGLCLKNLIENAKQHGESPIKVEVNETADEFHITVEDSGVGKLGNIDLLTKEFYKEKHSAGMGLGLNLVSRVLKTLGGRLDIKENPTRFSILIKKLVK